MIRPRLAALAFGTPTRRRLAALGLGAAVLLATVLLALRSAGGWLVVEDELKPADAIVVLGGELPLRAMEAARLYRDGWAAEVWLTAAGASGRDLALRRLGIERPPEQAYNQQILERLGVPHAAIRALPEGTINTVEDLQAVGAQTRARHGSRVILVTSKYHARRVRTLWHRLIGPDLEAVVRYPASDPFEPDRWWTTTEDALAVTREWLGLLNAWAGFPVRAIRR